MYKLAFVPKCLNYWFAIWNEQCCKNAKHYQLLVLFPSFGTGMNETVVINKTILLMPCTANASESQMSIFFPFRTDITVFLVNLQLEYCILFATSPRGFNPICCSPLHVPPPPAQCPVLQAASRQCFKSLPLGFACLSVPSKAESGRTLSILLMLIKAFSLTLMGVQSSFGMLLHILNSWWFLAGSSGTKPLQCRPKMCT